MTHFTVCVALTECIDFPITDSAEHKITHDQWDAIESAARYQLAPFGENGEWFKDGSRWDWWVIGGRYRDHWYCGNIVTIGKFSLEKQQEHDRARRREWWCSAAEKGLSESHRKLFYGIEPSDTLELYVERGVAACVPPPCCAFVRNRKWFEPGRMGWFATETATECAIKSPNDEAPDVCRFRHADSEAIITSYKMTFEEWKARWFDRFIRGLPPETVLVLVDCHI